MTDRPRRYSQTNVPSSTRKGVRGEGGETQEPRDQNSVDYFDMALKIIIVAVMVSIFVGFQAAAAPVAFTGVNQDLSFGAVAGPEQGSGRARISTGGVKTTFGGAIDLGGLHQAASIELSGDAGCLFEVILPASVTLSAGGNNVPIGNFTMASSQGQFRFSPGGRVTVTIGGEMDLPSGVRSADASTPIIINADYASSPDCP